MVAGTSPFPTTQWTAVVKAIRTENVERRHKAFAALCQTYWRPLYVFARRLGHDQHAAEDLTQGFFAYLSERPALEAAAAELGKLRTFLLTIFQRYAGDVRDRASAQRRGGGAQVFSLDDDEGDGLPPLNVAGTETPETLYDRAWAHALLRATMRDLQGLEEAAGRGQLFQVLRRQLHSEAAEQEDHPAAAVELGMNAAAIRQAVCRLRKKFRDCLRERIAATLNEPDNARIDEELRALKVALLQ